ncbi:MAG: metalloregulator ArsR/SmtB family transcription factor [Nitriliruptorales bacterium]|nr:metalloregulator ArsR/SmtB family transcription factor [Nitriliruptorales bacterium]
MGYQATLEVLADPTRRSIVERLHAGPLPVGVLAADLPVSRPAVSKHLRLMKDAGVVRMTADGTRHLYELDLRTLDEVRRYLDGFWEASLASFKDAAESTTKGRTS